MAIIKSCPIPPPSVFDEIPPLSIGSPEDPLPFRNLDEFERWLCGDYISRITYSQDYSKVECIGIFSSNQMLETCCLQYAINEVEYPKEFQKLLRRKIISHNHFSDEGFSKEDVYTWADLQLQEIRVIMPFKVVAFRTYSIKRLDPEHPTWDEIETIIKVQDPSLNNFKFNPNYRHKCLLFLKEKGLIEYSVDPPIPD